MGLSTKKTRQWKLQLTHSTSHPQYACIAYIYAQTMFNYLWINFKHFWNQLKRYSFPWFISCSFIENVCFLLFQLITTTRSLVLCAESRREMEDWLAALKAASLREYYEPGLTDTQDFLANHHHWCVQPNLFDIYFSLKNLIE